MPQKRIEFIDHLRGLALIGVVWFHTTHPAFLDFSFRIPLFFLVSGIFFRPYPLKKFIIKKINQLLVPFIFFYLIYYLFYMGLWWLKEGTLVTFNFASVFGLFGMYAGFENFIINPPLWFIFALLSMQIIMYALVRVSASKHFLLICALAITIFGVLYFFHIKTPFMISRCTPYFIYFALGYIFGTKTLHTIDGHRGKDYWLLLCFSCISFLSSIALIYCYGFKTDGQFGVLDYVAITSFIVLLMFIMKELYRYPFMKPFHFFGENTYVLLGIHEMILTVLLICANNYNWPKSILLGIVFVIITLLIAYPITLFCNKYLPKIIGKEPLLMTKA